MYKKFSKAGFSLNLICHCRKGRQQIGVDFYYFKFTIVQTFKLDFVWTYQGQAFGNPMIRIAQERKLASHTAKVNWRYVGTMLTLKVTGVEGGREPACSEFPSTFRVSIVPTQRQFTLVLASSDLGGHRGQYLNFPAKSLSQFLAPKSWWISIESFF